MRSNDSRASVHSATSKTFTESQSSFNKKRILSAKFGFFDFLFPFYDYLTQETRLYNWTYYVQVIVITVQFFLVSLWPNSLKYLNSTDTPGIILQTFISTIMFVGNDTNKDNPSSYFFTSTALFVLLLLAFLIQYISYHRSRVFSFSAMIFIRVVCEFILPFYIIPVFANLGWLLQLIINKESTYAIVYFFPSIFYAVFFLIFFYVTFTILSTSPFLSRAPTAMWDAKNWITLMVSNAVFAFLDSFVGNFPRFTVPILMVLHFIFCWHSLFTVYTFYFVKVSTAVSLGCVIYMCSITDIFSIVYYAQDGFNKWIFVGIFFPLLIIGYILSKLTHNGIKKKAIRILSLPDDEAKEAYEKEHLKSITLKAKAFLRIGIVEICPRFIDFSYIKYILSSMDSTDILAECLRIVCCFPQESRFMSQIFQVVITKSSLPMQTRFLLYQTERIKSVRQCSSVISSNESFSKLMAGDASSLDEIISIWRHPPTTMKPISKLADTITRTQNQWVETLNAYPNNSRFREEYTHFLIECKCDFTAGILQKYKMHQIEQGMNFATDKSFKFFVANNPKYLKKGIIDFKGNILIAHDKKKGSSLSNSSSHDSFLLSSSNGLSDEVEQSIGKALFTASKTRIGLQNAFYKRTSTPVKNFRIAGVMFFLIQVISTIVVFIMFNHIYAATVKSVSMISDINNVRFAANEGVLYSLINWAKTRNLIVDPPPTYKEFGEKDAIFEINSSITLGVASNHFTNSLQDFMKHVTFIARSGKSIDNYIPSFVTDHEDIPEYFFDGMEVKREIASNIQKTSVHIFTNVHTLANFKTSDQYVKDEHTYVNELMANYRDIHTNINRIVEDVKSFLRHELDYKERFHEITSIVFIVVVYILTVPLILLAIHAVYKEQDTFLSLMRTFSEKQIADCTQPILIHSNTIAGEAQATSVDFAEDGIDRHVCMYVMIILLGGFIPVLFGVGLINSKNQRYKIEDAVKWIQLSSVRKPLFIECLNAITTAVLLKNSDSTYDVSKFTLTDSDKQFKLAKEKIEELIKYDSLLNLGNATIKPCKNINDEIDEANTAANCSIINIKDQKSHQFIKCASVSDIINSLSTVTSKELESMDKIGEEIFLRISHSFLNHIGNRIWKSDTGIINYAMYLDNRQNQLMIFSIVVSSIFSIGTLISILTYASRCQILYETLLHLMLRMNPSMIISNPKVINFLLKRKSDSDITGSMTTARKIIHHSSDPIICLGGNEAVELINKATTTLLGYTPEQVLGQGISIFFNNESTEEIQKMITMMKLNQAPMTYESHVICITDSDTPIECKLTLIGMRMKDENKEGASSYVIIVSDEEELAEGKRKAEEAKQKSETLLYHILPMDIVLRINRGETNISFSVPSATIIFLDIQRFSDFASSMSPSQIMGALSLMFGSFDDILTRYPIVIKIKLIGDIYMAAGGLFSPDEPPQKHAEACVKFAVEALQCLDDINNKLSSNLNLRIGINTGGPVIAGVLGTDKPVFDIIGDPINVAARLQSTDIVGKIQISQTTHDLINQADYLIEKRNDVFLKGKGKSTAYLLSQQSQLAISFSSSSHFKTIPSDENVLQSLI